MRIAHLADLHLGYRAYHRLAPGGTNQRERDVADALAAAVDQVVEAGPDLILVAGDVFHTVRPSNGAIMDGFRQFMRLRAGLPRAPVVMIAGNHDSPRSVDTGSILRLLGEIPDTHVADDGARCIRLESLDASVLCLPHAALIGEEPPVIEPDDAGTNVLMLHGTVSGAGIDETLLRMVEYGGAHLDRSDLKEDAWDYIALGHYHNALRIAPNMWYAGATERTATNVWAEADTRKGWVLYDTDARTGEFRDIPTREVVDLPRFSARRRGRGTATGDAWLSADEIDGRIADAVSEVPGGVEGKIVRLVITDVPRELFRELDHRQIRALKAEALHFHLDARRPEVRERHVSEEVRRRTLEEELEAFLKDWEPSTPGVDRERLLAVGARYLADTEDWREGLPELPLEESSSISSLAGRPEGSRPEPDSGQSGRETDSSEPEAEKAGAEGAVEAAVAGEFEAEPAGEVEAEEGTKEAAARSARAAAKDAGADAGKSEAGGKRAEAGPEADAGVATSGSTEPSTSTNSTPSANTTQTTTSPEATP